MSIAFNQPYSALDGNVIRVISRYVGDDRDMRLQKHRKNLNSLNQSWIEQAIPEVYTQAMMELGATICKPRNPLCDKCPLHSDCVAYQEGRQQDLPVLSKLDKAKAYHYITLIIEDQEYYYLRKRDEELLKGMYEYPQYDAESIRQVEDQLAEEGVHLRIDEDYSREKHVFSHQIWYMEIHHAQLLSSQPNMWIPIQKDKINDIPMAIAHRKIKIT